jgi:hypothetical protein
MASHASPLRKKCTPFDPSDVTVIFFSPRGVELLVKGTPTLKTLPAKQLNLARVEALMCK